MALWKKKARKRKAPPSTANTSSPSPQKQRKLFSPEVKLLAVKALEAGLTPAEVEIPSGAANGVILAQGGRFGGWSLYLKDGKPAYTYNFLGLSRYTVTAPNALPAGSVTIVLDFVYDGGGLGKGGMATLAVNGEAVAKGRIEKTQPLIFSADETADVGLDNQTPVAEGIGIGRDRTRFTGKIRKVTIEVKDVK